MLQCVAEPLPRHRGKQRLGERKKYTLVCLTFPYSFLSPQLTLVVTRYPHLLKLLLRNAKQLESRVRHWEVHFFRPVAPLLTATQLEAYTKQKLCKE